MSANASSSRNTQVAKTNKSTVKDTQAAKQSTTNAAIAQCWMPNSARCHRDQVTCRCPTCRSKSVGGLELAFATVEDWLAGHNLYAWLDPLGSGFHVVAIKSCTEKFLEKVHGDEYAKGVRFWMNFEKNRFDVRRPRTQAASASSEAPQEQAAAESTSAEPATAEPAKPKRPTIPPAPAVNPWSKGKQEHKQEHKADPDATAELKKPLPKKEKKIHGSPKTGKWKKVDAELTPDSRHVVIKTESSQQVSAPGTRIAPFDLRLETSCKHGAQCRNKTHTDTSKFVCPYNHHTTATIIAKGEPIPDSHCSYDKVTLVDGKVKVDKCKNKACPKDHLEHHVAYCKGFAGASNTPQPVQQAVQVVYVLPNGQMMHGPPMMQPPMMQPPMMQPPMMPQFTAPRFHGKPQNKRRPNPPNYAPPKPKQELTDAEFEASLESELDIKPESESEHEPEDDGCGGKRCGNMTPGFCTCDEEELEEELEDEDAILSRAATVAATQ